MQGIIHYSVQSLGSSTLGWQVLVQSSEGSHVGYVCWLLDHCSRLGLEEVMMEIMVVVLVVVIMIMIVINCIHKKRAHYKF